MLRYSFRTLLLVLLAVFLTGCRSGKSAGGSTKYQRPPVVQVSQPQLESEAMLIEAKMNQELERTEKALQLYRTVITRSPNCHAAYYEMGTIYESANMLDSALFFTRKAEALDPSNQWYKMQLCAIYRRQGDFRNEARTWESLIKLAPDKLDYYYELSNTHMLNENIEASVEALNRVEKRIGVSEAISLQKHKLWLAIGRNDKALQEIERLAETMPQEKKYNELMAETYMKQKQYAKAKKYYDRIAAAHPTDDYIHISLANYYHQTGDAESTYSELRKGLRSEALNCTDKIQILTSIYSTEEMYAYPPGHAFQLLEELIQLCYDTMTYAPLYGEVLMNQRRYAEAAEQFRRYLSIDSSRYEVWQAYLLAMLMDTTDRREALSATAMQAQRLFPFQVMPYFVEGQCHVLASDYAKAEKPLVQCVKLGFSNHFLEPETYNLLAETYYRLERYEEAWVCFDKSLAVEPENIPTLNNYAYYLSERSVSLDKAERMSRLTINAEPDNATYLDTYAWILFKMGRPNDALPYMEKAVKNDGEKSSTLLEHLETIRRAAGK